MASQGAGRRRELERALEQSSWDAAAASDPGGSAARWADCAEVLVPSADGGPWQRGSVVVGGVAQRAKRALEHMLEVLSEQCAAAAAAGGGGGGRDGDGDDRGGVTCGVARRRAAPCAL